MRFVVALLLCVAVSSGSSVGTEKKIDELYAVLNSRTDAIMNSRPKLEAGWNAFTENPNAASPPAVSASEDEKHNEAVRATSESLAIIKAKMLEQQKAWHEVMERWHKVVAEQRQYEEDNPGLGCVYYGDCPKVGEIEEILGQCPMEIIQDNVEGAVDFAGVFDKVVAGVIYVVTQLILALGVFYVLCQLRLSCVQ